MQTTEAQIASEDQQRLAVARETMEAEAEAIRVAAGRLNGTLTRAVKLIVDHSGKVVVTGLGKSGLVGQKLVATLCSTGTPSVFLHPAEALHGDLGVYEPGDPTILITKSGSTAELLRLVPMLRQFDSPLIGILGNTSCQLASMVDVLLDGSVASEADPCNIAPTSSAVVAMAIGDALASALMHARHFTVEDFAKYHAGGQIGRNLLLTVRDAFHAAPGIAMVEARDTLRQIVVAMTQFPYGAACVVSADGKLEGIITDGDLRRALQQHEDMRALRSEDIMTRAPVSILPEAKLGEALHLMENRPSQISVLPVVDTEQRCLGLIRIHDIYNPAGALF